uniref:NADH:ubiquinone reductase (H(+)-translocating) n=1 Tax=Gyrodactylus kobayashii TaxID=89149 RepID=A0A166A4F0_9PLAT|nr:NADH dehydrogenase subunit 5 [Gyrodactylus kobayashii]AMZ79737.1 NADH dehydrogenase subunit 5 [Gyrodactylus kobayashii]
MGLSITNFVVIVLLFTFLSLYTLDFNLVISLCSLDYLVNLYTSFTIDLLSTSCLGMLMSCFIIAGIFYWHYFSWHSDYLIVNIQVFVLSMAFLIFTSSSINSFIGWEVLGVSSFFLILYYGIYCSSRAAMITIISSRLGDVGFFIFISCCLSDTIPSISILCSIFIMFLLISKSAVFPLTSWLLEAMRAPTPVSSLVHSSTLVAAGIVLICRYESLLVGGYYSYLFYSLCIFTVIISATCAFFYSDTKKIIALSTCNNISWCYIYLYNSMWELCIIQLVCHGIFKCILFCLIGDFLVNSNNSQNKSMHYYFGSEAYSIIVTIVCLFISGAPFLGVYFSKHLFIAYLSESTSLVPCLLITLGLSLSFLYTFRLLNVLNSDNNSNTGGFNNVYIVSIIILPYYVFINSLISNSILEDSLPGFILNILVNSLILLMSLGGYLLSLNINDKWFTGLYGQDFMIMDSIQVLSFLSSFTYCLSIFRWESYCVSLFSEYRLRFNTSIGFLLVVSLMFYILLILL